MLGSEEGPQPVSQLAPPIYLGLQGGSQLTQGSPLGRRQRSTMILRGTEDRKQAGFQLSRVIEPEDEPTPGL